MFIILICLLGSGGVNTRYKVGVFLTDRGTVQGNTVGISLSWVFLESWKCKLWIYVYDETVIGLLVLTNHRRLWVESLGNLWNDIPQHSSLSLLLVQPGMEQFFGITRSKIQHNTPSPQYNAQLHHQLNVHKTTQNTQNFRTCTSVHYNCNFIWKGEVEV